MWFGVDGMEELGDIIPQLYCDVLWYIQLNKAVFLCYLLPWNDGNPSLFTAWKFDIIVLLGYIHDKPYLSKFPPSAISDKKWPIILQSRIFLPTLYLFVFLNNYLWEGDYSPKKQISCIETVKEIIEPMEAFVLNYCTSSNIHKYVIDPNLST